MTLFFIILIALVVYQFSTRKSLAQIYPQFSKVQIRRLSNVPFNFAAWVLLFVLCANMLSALTSMIGELFNVDNYIGLFGGGWLGIILRFLRSSGFIGDIQEPMALLQYRGTISLICTVTLVSCVICGSALIAFCRELKKAKLNGTAILAYYYLSIACGLTSFLVFMWGLYEFNELLNHAIIFHMEEIYFFLSLVFVVSSAAGIFWGNQDMKKLLALPQCETYTWQQVLAKIKITTDNGQQQINEKQIVGIALCLSLLVTGYVILSTFPVSAEAEEGHAIYQPIKSEPTNTGKGEIVAPSIEDEEPEDENPVVSRADYIIGDVEVTDEDIIVAEGLSDEEYCIKLITQLFTSNFVILDANGGVSFYETSRFIEYSKCMEAPLVVLGEDYSIGDGLINISKIEKMEGYENLYMVQYYGDYWGIYISNSVVVVMNKEDGKWKVDNAYHKNEDDGQYHLLIDYSKSPEYYYDCPMCGDC